MYIYLLFFLAIATSRRSPGQRFLSSQKFMAGQDGLCVSACAWPLIHYFSHLLVAIISEATLISLMISSMAFVADVSFTWELRLESQDDKTLVAMAPCMMMIHCFQARASVTLSVHCFHNVCLYGQGWWLP